VKEKKNMPETEKGRAEAIKSFGSSFVQEE